MSKFISYLKENRNEIVLAMMSASAAMTGSTLDWRLLAELREKK